MRILIIYAHQFWYRAFHIWVWYHLKVNLTDFNRFFLILFVTFFNVFHAFPTISSFIIEGAVVNTGVDGWIFVTKGDLLYACAKKTKSFPRSVKIAKFDRKKKRKSSKWKENEGLYRDYFLSSRYYIHKTYFSCFNFVLLSWSIIFWTLQECNIFCIIIYWHYFKLHLNIIGYIIQHFSPGLRYKQPDCLYVMTASLLNYSPTQV